MTAVSLRDNMLSNDSSENKELLLSATYEDRVLVLFISRPIVTKLVS